MTDTVAPARQSLVIRDWIPDQITNGDGKGRWKAIKARKSAKIMAWTCAKHAQWHFVPGRVRLSITYVFGVKRTRDVDNLYARSVGLVNGLKGDWFTDDSTDYLDLHVDALVVPGVRETRITLEQIEYNEGVLKGQGPALREQPGPRRQGGLEP